MDDAWQESFRQRMRAFETHRSPSPGELSASIKVRITSGCFHREHSPHAYTLIDKRLKAAATTDDGIVLEEHESGPELLVWFAVTTAGLTLAKSVIDLVVTIIKARSEGIERGDRPSDPIELIVRRTAAGQEYREETILRIGHKDPVDVTAIEAKIREALIRLGKADGEDL